MKRILIAILLLTAALSPRAQEVAFPYPAVPGDLEGQGERLQWLMENFWSCFDFNDLSETNSAVAEQGIADFLNIYAYLCNDSVRAGRIAQAFASHLSTDTPTRPLFDDLIDKYLGDHESPVRNDLVYEYLLRALPRTPQQDFRLAQISRNQQGHPAADFEYVTRGGQHQHLYETKSTWTLLIFNDPECEHCQELLPKLAEEPLLQREELHVIAIYADNNTERWFSEDHHFPANWTDAYSPGGELMSRQKYYLQALPTLYLLDEDKRVVLKNPPIPDLLTTLHDLLTPTP